MEVDTKLNRSLFTQGNDIRVVVEDCGKIDECPDKKAPYRLPGACCIGCGGYRNNFLLLLEFYPCSFS